MSRHAGKRKTAPPEGALGTWSHCGLHIPHETHTHDIETNGSTHHDVVCLGTPGRPRKHFTPTSPLRPYITEGD